MIRVAIIDDDESVRKTISEVLSASGIKTTTYESALCFLDKASDDDFDVMVVDKDMPGMTGNELYQKLKSQDILPSRFILMSGTFSSENTLSVVSLEEPILLAKPFRLAELLKLVSGCQ
jgi:two-component system response regulator YesN